MDEYIERSAAIEAAKHAWAKGLEPSQYIEALPAADVAPVVHGRWIPVRESEMTGWDPTVAGCDPIAGYICSVCKEEAVYDCNDNFVLSDYCPICGAKMDGWKENENE
jgi:hypothetical protein